jgi:hypothetical protein
MTSVEDTQVNDLHTGFLSLLPQLKQLARRANHHITHRQDREDAIADTIANVWELCEHAMLGGPTEPKANPLFKPTLCRQRRSARRKHDTRRRRPSTTANVPATTTSEPNDPTRAPARMPPQYYALMEQLSLPPALRSYAAGPT